MVSSAKLGRLQPTALGRPVKTYVMHQGWLVYLVLYVLPILLGVIAWHGEGPWTTIIAVAIPLLVITGLLDLLVLRRTRLVLHEHGLTWGMKLVGSPPEAVMYREIYPELVATYNNLRKAAREMDVPILAPMFSWTPLSRAGVSFTVRQARRVDSKTGALTPRTATRYENTIEFFALRCRPEKFIADLQRLMMANGVPGAENLHRYALPPTMLTGNQADRYRQIPGDDLGLLDRPTSPDQMPGIQPERWHLYQRIWASTPITPEERAAEAEEWARVARKHGLDET